MEKKTDEFFVSKFENKVKSENKPVRFLYKIEDICPERKMDEFPFATFLLKSGQTKQLLSPFTSSYSRFCLQKDQVVKKNL